MKPLIPQDLHLQYQTLRRILGFVKPYSRRLIIGIVASIASGAFGSSPIALLKYLFDTVIDSNRIEYAYLFSFAVVIFYLLKGLSSYVQTYTMSWVGQRMIYDLREITFGHLMTMPVNYHKTTRVGELIARIISDISLMEMAVSRVLGRLILSFFSFFPPLIIVFYISWKLSLIAFVVLPLTLYPIVRFARKLKRVSSRAQKEIGNLTSIMSECFYGMNIVKAFNMEAFEADRFKRSNESYNRAMMKAAQVSAVSSPLLEVIGAIATAVIFGLGLNLIIEGTMTKGELMAFLASLFVMYDPIKKVSTLNYDIQRAIAGAERIFEILDTPSPIADSPTAITLTRASGAIEFRDISFSYESDTTVLNSISFTVNPGETVAIVGHSGGGKSTLISMIPRFYDPDSGSILIDGINIRDMTMHSLREQIGIVTQDTVLFNDTVWTNLCYGRTDFSEEQVVSAARAAFAHEFITALPDGYQTVIGERGHTMSGGQRQRLAIARAILKNPPILILDEATSSLDSESEKLIQEALDSLISNRTTLVIAHRLSTIRRVDRILVIDQGQIVESGTHDQLINHDGPYKNFYMLQTRPDSI